MAADVTREHVSDFITDLLATRSASTASVRFRAGCGVRFGVGLGRQNS